MILELSKQVCSFALAERLKELGVPQDSHFVYRHWRGDGQIIIDVKKEKYFDYPKYRRTIITWGVICAAYTSSELGEFLRIADADIIYRVNTLKYGLEILDGRYVSAETEANARALMLIYLLEQGLVTSNAK